MTRIEARKIAEVITNEQIKQMFDKAKNSITDWTVVSICNKGMTKGTAWNILASNFDMEKTHHILAKTTMVREFGAFLPKELIPPPKSKKYLPPPIHQEPKFD